MEGLTRLVSESLVRHGLDRPVDYRRLRWSRWFRCESHHSLLQVPSQPGVFALAEEIVDLHVGTAALGCPSERSSAGFVRDGVLAPGVDSSATASNPASRRMLAVTQFFEADDMAFALDRMLTRDNPLRAHLNSGRCFVRFVVIEDLFQRRSICHALTQWLSNSAESKTGIGSHFAASLELPRTHDVGRTLLSNNADPSLTRAGEPAVAPTARPTAAPQLDSGAAAAKDERRFSAASEPEKVRGFSPCRTR